jgi:hypothetical protein
MAQLLGEKEPQTFVAYSLRNYDYAYGTKVDILLVGRFQDNPVHYLLMSKLNTFRILR